MKTNIGISEKNLVKSCAILSSTLSNEMTVYIKTRKAHWNVTGQSFMELHKLFEDQYKQQEQSIDQIAERIAKLGHNTIGTMHEFLKLSIIKENPDKYTSSKDTLKELLKDHETIIVQLRKDITTLSEADKDAGTADFITGLLKEHETTAWILGRYLN